MKAIEQIKQRKLELYEGREKYFLILKRLENKDDEAAKAAANLAAQIYSEKISELDWVLKDE